MILSIYAMFYMDNSESAFSDIQQVGSTTEQFIGRLVVRL
jgi:hypothetical protein